ncbi:phosphoglycolate phosphatase [Pacificibacter maritimus]|uniref:phosphoglycolate phosphatase n=1 Tax=Pacificibacter maritimus TaxID=762213 RepID=A0A3N4UWU9_9RHOB|nr:HAD family hydrolase [Pacificibacter maritimus]RPE72019.1 phosphoglycolate phosphatase [Pacificibacter maritimus]
MTQTLNKPAKAILFDKDGTLFDFQKTWAPWAAAMIADLARGEKAVLAKAGQAVPQDLDRQIAHTVGFDLDNGAFQADSLAVAGTAYEVAQALSQVITGLSDSEVLDYLMPSKMSMTPVVVPQLKQALEGLKQAGFRLGVVTNDFEHVAREHLEQVNISELFEVVIGCDSGHGAKPAPEGCLAAAAHLAVPAPDTYMVGDSLHDLEAAQRAGMRPIGVLTGTASRDDLAHLAAHVFADVADFVRFLTKSPL